MPDHDTSYDQSRPIEEWSDEELLAQFRYVKAELTDEDPGDRDGDGAPADVIEEEIKRRGLEPDREDVIPDASSRWDPGDESDAVSALCGCRGNRARSRKAKQWWRIRLPVRMTI